MSSSDLDNKTWFISAVSEEFKQTRIDLADALKDYGITVQVQEDFRQDARADLLVKLNNYICGCAYVIHFIGEKPGRGPTAPDPRKRPHAVQEYVDHCVQTSLPFLKHRPEILELLGDFSDPSYIPDLSYTQWEAFIALHHGVNLLMYQPKDLFSPGSGGADPGAARQRAHVARLKNSINKRPTLYTNPFKLITQILHDTGLKTAPAHRSGKAVCALRPPLTLFVGREKKMQELHDAFGRGKRVVATGLGGIGKTCIVTEYAHQYAEYYEERLLISAENQAALQASVAGLATPRFMGAPAPLELGLGPETDQALRCKAVLNWLRENWGWLLIVDNVDDLEMHDVVGEEIGRLTRGNTLVTARLGGWPRTFIEVKLDFLSQECSVELLLKYTDGERGDSDTDPQDACELAEELAGLAIGLTQAGAFIAARKITLREYLQGWRTNKPALMDDPNYDPKVTLYPRTVAVTWTTTMQHLRPASLFLLDILSWLAPDPIPKRLLAVPVGLLARPWSAAALAYVPEEIRADLQGEAPLLELDRFSMVNLEAGQIIIHRSVQDVGRIEQRKAGRAANRLACATQWLADDFIRPPSLENQRANIVHELVPLVPHARALLAARDHDREPALAIARARLQCALAGVFEGQGLLASAEEAALDSVRAARELDLARDPGGPARLCLVLALVQLSSAHAARGHADKAVPVAAEAVERARALCDEFPGNLTMLYSLYESLWKKGNALSDQGLYGQALSGYGEMLPLARRLLATQPDDPLYQRNVFVALSYVARTHFQLGSTEAAGAEYRQAFDMIKALHETTAAYLSVQRDLAVSYGSIAAIHLQKGEMTQAMDAMQEELKIFRELRKKRPGNLGYLRDFAGVLDSLIDIYETQGNHAAAYDTCKEALDARWTVLQKDPQNVSDQTHTLNVIASITAGSLFFPDRAKAIALFKEASEVLDWLRKDNTMPNEEMPDTLSTLNDLAIGHSQPGDIRMQKSELQIKLTACQQQLSNHRMLLKMQPDNLRYKRDVAGALSHIASIQYRQEEYVAAGNTHREELALRYSVLGKDMQNISDQREALRVIGNLLLVTASYPDKNEAKVLLEEAQTVLQRLREDNSLPDEVVGLAPRLRAELRRLEEGITAERDLRDHEGQLAALRFALSAKPGDVATSREAADEAMAVGDLHAARGAKEQADNALVEELSLRQTILTREPALPEEQEKAFAAIGKARDRVVTDNTFTRASAKRLLQGALAVLDELAKDPTATARADELGLQLHGQSRRIEDGQLYEEAMSLSHALPSVPAAVIERLAALDIHDPAWQAAYWSLYLEPATDAESIARVQAGRRALAPDVAAALSADLEPAHAWPLAFYPGYSLALLLPPAGGDGAPPRAHAWLLTDGESAFRLAGSVEPFNRLHSRLQFKLEAAHAEVFLRLFCFFVRADNEPFLVMDRRMLALLPGTPGDDAGVDQVEAGFDPRPVPEARSRGHHGALATILYGHAVFRAAFTLSDEGQVRMVDDQPLNAASRQDAP